MGEGGHGKLLAHYLFSITHPETSRIIYNLQDYHPLIDK